MHHALPAALSASAATSHQVLLLICCVSLTAVLASFALGFQLADWKNGKQDKRRSAEALKMLEEVMRRHPDPAPGANPER